ncbi:MAG: glycosyltransferase family 1 protein [Patescibacteria group bacterium]
MRIAIDVSPLTSKKSLQHRVRGTGFYIEYLKKHLVSYYPNNQYIFFTRGEKIPENVDLVHYPYFEPFFLTLPFARKYKAAVTVHDLTPLVFPRNFPSGLRGIIKWKIQKFLLEKIDALIADSESSKNDILKFTNIPENKIHVVYLAASPSFKKINTSALQSIKQKYKLPDKFVLYVGDVTWNKNLPRLVEAIKKINLTMVMIGAALVRKDFDWTNPWNQDLFSVIKSIGNDRRFIRHGFIPAKDLVVIYNLATVFAMPSLYEGFGLPILEAMSCGCPVVASKNGSIPEVAGGGVYYVDPYDINELANGIGEVYFNQKLRKELALKGLAQAKKFSWEKTTKKTIDVYRSVVNHSSIS